jgi:GTP-binding protein EngB required for normal cell division
MSDAVIGRLSEKTLGPILDCVSTIRSGYNLSALTPRLDACRALIEAEETVDVVALGRFKAGKSSLLNFLCRRAVLPVGVIPVTAVITRLRYDAVEKAIIHHQNGSVEEVPVDDVPLFVAESENHGNFKKVASVTVQLPTMNSYRSLQFVDTPGLDSIFEHSTEAALNWLPRAGLALVTVSVDPPLSKQDLALLRLLRETTPRIAVVLTKADLLSERQAEEVTEFVRERLREEFGSVLPLYLFSIRASHLELQQKFESGLLESLHRDCAAAHSEILHFKLTALLHQTRDYLSFALAAAERADADRRKLKEQIVGEQTNFDSIRMEFTALGRELAGHTRPWIMKRMQELQGDVATRAAAEIGLRMSVRNTNLWKLTRAFDLGLREVMAREMSEISEREAVHFCAPLEKAQAMFTRAVQAFRDRLAGNILQALGIRFSPEPLDFPVRTPSRPSIAIGNPFMFDVDLLWFVIPMKIFRPWFEKRLLARVPQEAQKNMSRLASLWTEAVNTSIAGIERAALQCVLEQLSTIESLLSKTASEAEKIRKDLRDIDLQSAALLAAARDEFGPPAIS